MDLLFDIIAEFFGFDVTKRWHAFRMRKVHSVVRFRNERAQVYFLPAYGRFTYRHGKHRLVLHPRHGQPVPAHQAQSALGQQFGGAWVYEAVEKNDGHEMIWPEDPRD